MALGKNVITLRESKGWSQADLVRRLKEHLPQDQHDKIQGAISNMERRDSSQSKYIKELALVLQHPMAELVTTLNRFETAASRQPSPPPTIEQTKIGYATTPETNTHSIKQYDAQGAMGTGILLREQSGVIHEWQISDDWIQKNLKDYTSITNICIVTGFGDSMQGLYNSGDPLIMDKGINQVDYDGVYFFRIEDEGYIKRLQRIPGQGIKVISDNKQYDPWFIQKDMDVEIFGRVIKAWRGNNL